MADTLVSEVLLIGGAASSVGRAIDVANCERVIMSVVVSVTAATLATTTVGLAGTNDPDRAAAGLGSQTLTSGTGISVLASGITAPSGLVTFASPAIGSYEILVAFTSVPRFVRPILTYGTGGGTVSFVVSVAGWSVR